MIKYPSLEIKWLPNSFLKGLDRVNITITTEDHCSGYYDSQRNLIAISEIVDDYDVGGTIAHELRHHWQYSKFGPPKNYITWQSLQHLEYKEAIARYFLSNKIEMDALLFEYKVARGELNTYFMDILHDYNKRLTME